MKNRLVWAILTGEYPPDVGGVSDYTQQVVRGLAEAGDEVHVWSPRPAMGCAPQDRGVTVHHLQDRYSPRSLMRLHAELKNLDSDYRLLLQYTGSAFGLLGGNFPFGIWLWMQRKPTWVMFHELYMPLTWAQPIKHNVLAIAQRILAALVMQSTERIYVSIPNWAERLEPLRDGQRLEWTPVPSNIPTDVDPQLVLAARVSVSVATRPGSAGTLWDIRKCHYPISYGRHSLAVIFGASPADAPRRPRQRGFSSPACRGFP